MNETSTKRRRRRTSASTKPAKAARARRANNRSGDVDIERHAGRIAAIAGARERGIIAADSLTRVAQQLAPESARKRRATLPISDLRHVARQLSATSDTVATPNASSRVRGGALDLVGARRPVMLELVAGRGHYERVIAAVREAQISVWIATANVKELLVEHTPREKTRARGRTRSSARSAYVSILAILDELAQRGVELRVLHAELPSRPFREAIAQQPRLVGGGLELRRCPRVHLKTVIVDGALLYLGSANWTGAGLGAKGSGRRNFELGIVTDDGPLLDQVQGLYEQIWSGGECASCRLVDVCPGPLAAYLDSTISSG